MGPRAPFLRCFASTATPNPPRFSVGRSNVANICWHNRAWQRTDTAVGYRKVLGTGHSTAYLTVRPGLPTPLPAYQPQPNERTSQVQVRNASRLRILLSML